MRVVEIIGSEDCHDIRVLYEWMETFAPVTVGEHKCFFKQIWCIWAAVLLLKRSLSLQS